MLQALRPSFPNHHFPTSDNLTVYEEPDNGGSSTDPMSSEQNRLKTFANWPNPHISPADLAKAGFYYTRIGDRVRCPFCNVEVEYWEEGDDALLEHQRWCSECSFVRGQNCGNAPLSGSIQAQMSSDGYDTCGRYGIEVRPNSFPESDNVAKYAVPRGKGPTYPEFITLEKRLESFRDWPISIKQKPKELSEAGFLYSGKGDKTICFSCGGGLKNWEESDDPWEQHAKWFSACEFLTLQKGQKFISDICNKSPASISSSEASSLVEASSTSSAKQSSTSTGTIDLNRNQEPKEGTSSTLCKICYNKEIGVAFLPCGHVVACVDCAPALTKCAVCCGEIAASCRVFLS